MQQLKMQSDRIEDYLCDLTSSPILDKTILQAAKNFTAYGGDTVAKAKAIFEFVRDRFPHTFDIGAAEVSRNAAEVLQYGHGVCYAKSMLLAAIMRKNKIPAGFCYQLLMMDDKTDPRLVLHGLNAVYLEKPGRWVRLDARGNKPGVDAQFLLDEEKLAFPVRAQLGEIDYDTVFTQPAAIVVRSLKISQTAAELLKNLPGRL